MATKIVTKNSSTASSVPTAAQLVQGELAVNVADKRLYTEDNAGNIVELGTNPLGEIIANGGIALGDNDKATFGASDDLQIYHTGSYSAITDVGTGAFYIGGADFVDIGDSTLSGTSARFHVNDRVDLYHDNAIKLATTSTGIDVTGTATMDGLTVDGSLGTFAVDTQGAIVTLSRPSTNYIRASHASGALRFDTGGSVARLNIASNGDISFYEDTGTTPKLFWDASAESLGIGTSSPAYKTVISANGASGIEFGPAYSGTSNLVQHYSRSGGVYVDAVVEAAQHRFHISGSERMRIDSSGNVGIGTSNATPSNGEGMCLGSSATITRLDMRNSTTGDATGDGTSLQLNGNNFTIENRESGYVAIATSLTERMRIDSSGNVNIASGRLRVQAGDDEGTQLNAWTTAGGNGNVAAFNLVFNTGANSSRTERMRIDSSGRVLVNTTSNIGGARFNVEHTTDCIGCNLGPSASGTRYFMYFTYNGTNVGSIRGGPSSTAFTTSSDYRLKENVVPMTGSIDRVKALKPSRFNFIVDADTTVDGFLAHEAQTVVPECVTGTKDAMRDEEYEVTAAIEEVRDEDDNITTEAVEAVMGTRSVPDMQGIDQSKLVPLLTATIQELIARIEALENGE